MYVRQISSFFSIRWNTKKKRNVRKRDRNRNKKAEAEKTKNIREIEREENFSYSRIANTE